MGLIIVELAVKVNIAAITKELSASKIRICRNFPNCDFGSMPAYLRDLARPGLDP